MLISTEISHQNSPILNLSLITTESGHFFYEVLKKSDKNVIFLTHQVESNTIFDIDSLRISRFFVDFRASSAIIKMGKNHVSSIEAINCTSPLPATILLQWKHVNFNRNITLVAHQNSPILNLSLITTGNGHFFMKC
jgi:hypothetical protein